MSFATLALLIATALLPGVGRGGPAATPPLCAAPWTADGDQLDGRFGTVAPAGDVDHDGYADVLVGAYAYDHPEVDEGRVVLYRGGPLGLSASASWSAESDQAAARFGDKLSTAGDVNGDGYADVINGAGLYDGGLVDEGRAYVHLGGPSGLAASAGWFAEGNQTGANFGACVQAAGDVNRDGFDDVIVGAWLYDHGESDEGGAFVYLGSDSGLADTPAWQGESNSVGAVYGYFCTRAGDLNGDGYEDIVVGARRFGGNGIRKEGRVYVYYGSASGPSVTPGWIKDGGQKDGELGTSPAPAGDVNGDGYDDLLVNAPRFDAPNVDEGKVWLYLGSSSGLATTPSWMAEGDQDSAQFGYHMDGAGDVNHDGYDDIIISSIGYDANGLDDAGAVFLYLGSPTGPSAAPDWIQNGDQLRGELGHAARGVGDVDGDGNDDFMTGAIYRDGAYENSGRAYLFYGCSDATTHVPESPATLSLVLQGPTPSRGRVRLAFSAPVAGHMRLEIRDVMGRRVAVLVDGVFEPGARTVEWDARADGGRATPAGIYFARLETPAGQRGLRIIRLP